MADQSAPEIELELTYLAASVPREISGVDPKKMVDVYIPAGAEHPRLRLRRKGDKFELTKKTPVQEGDASMHNEVTITLDEAEFKALQNASTMSVTKDRYNVDIDGHPAEVDVFTGELTGLILIDFEFASRAELDAFTAPKVCLADVTQEDFIAGGLLAGKTYKDIEPKLKGFNYSPLEV